MDLARARYLVSNQGRADLAGLEESLGALDVVQLSVALRKQFDAATAAALAEQITLRARARTRFGAAANEMLFSSEGLEMLTHPLVSTRRAHRLAQAGLPIVDLTCGLGGDLRACTAAGAQATGLDHDPVMALLARANAATDTVVGDAAHAPFDLRGKALIIDPARRGAAGRRFDPDSFSPNWDTSMRLLRGSALGVVKTAPGIAHEHVPPECELEFVQLDRALREAAIWHGHGAVAGLRRAVLLPSGATLDSSEPEVSGDTRPPGPFVFDPESCVTRAGVVRQLAARLGATLMDPQVAYLTAGAPAFDVMAATFEVLDVLPFSLSRLRDRLREKSWRPDEIRRRAFPVEPDELRRLLKVKAGTPVTLLTTTLAGDRTVIVARRLHRQ